MAAFKIEKNWFLGPRCIKEGKSQRGILGQFAGILPFKLEFESSDTVRELAQKIKRTIFKDYRHQDLPISHLYRSLNLHEHDRKQLFEVVVNYLKSGCKCAFFWIRGQNVQRSQ